MKTLFVYLLVIFGYNTVSAQKTITSLPFNNEEIRHMIVDSAYEIYLLNADLEEIYSLSSDSILGNSYSNTSFTHILNKSLYSLCSINDEHAIIFGNMNYDVTNTHGSGYYYTSDGGRTWVIMPIKSNSTFYSACALNDGHVWMGSGKGEIFYSNDHAQNMMELNSPMKGADRIKMLYMKDSMFGLVGGLYNTLYYTTDNWTSYHHLPSPHDQELIKGTNAIGESIEKMCIWDSTMVIQQGGEVFYSSLKKLKWKRFNTALRLFDVDTHHNLLYGIDKQNRIYAYYSPDSLVQLAQAKSNAPVTMLKAGNEQVLLSDDYKVILYKEGKFTELPSTHNHVNINSQKGVTSFLGIPMLNENTMIYDLQSNPFPIIKCTGVDGTDIWYLNNHRGFNLIGTLYDLGY